MLVPLDHKSKKANLALHDLITKSQKLEKVTILEEWKDDGLPCFSLKLVIDGKSHKLHAWWEDNARAIHRAELGKGLGPLLKKWKEDIDLLLE